MTATPAPPRTTAPRPPSPPAVPATRRGVAGFRAPVAAGIALVLLAGVCVLLFGPGRGLRNDISHLRTDLHASRQGIYGTLDTNRTQLADATRQLQITEQSLTLQQQGLAIASGTEQQVTTAATSTAQIAAETSATLATVRQVIASLGPLQRLPGTFDAAVQALQAGVALARTTLDVAQQTLATGRSALDVAIATLGTLKQSRDVQLQLLAVAQATLAQTQEINRKIP